VRLHEYVALTWGVDDGGYALRVDIRRRFGDGVPHRGHANINAEMAILCGGSIGMEKQTLEKLEAAFAAVENDLSGRVIELATKSTAGTLSQDEQAEYEHIVRLNDLLSLLKLQTEEYWAPRIAS
jgi:hypothetical protein